MLPSNSSWGRSLRGGKRGEYLNVYFEEDSLSADWLDSG